MKHSNLLKKDKSIAKRIYVFLFICSISLVNSQSKRFYYTLDFKIDTADTYKRDLLVLQINKDDNVFLSNEFITVDSINSVKKVKEYPYPVFKDIIIWNKKSASFDYIKNLSLNYYKYNSKKDLKWQLTNEKKKIGNFEVQKAFTEYSGRKWTAWFCNEIPLSYGPYVFYGLPGLILELYDDKKDFKFSFVKNKNYPEENNSLKMIDNLTQPILLTIKEPEWKQIQKNYYDSPLNEYKKGEAYMTKDSGEEYTLQDYRDLEKNIQSQIKRYNNPLELSEKIKY
ncbi:GLPGLI family protein [Chryseobacterium sp. H1D6B]|uniref:GLPGLI family protein n=1 Tax=Chryseobacterium sp. H1D6B TaxID=2940588 RepID=UPI0015CC48BB|nr:GLPGLI family protein [Chryseobacterium sp. H1D6B]MDH6252206.1 GLPGLI family protein [Chryseobacterium sp. H1D6B]